MQKIVWGAHARAWGSVACGVGCEPAVSAMQQSGCCELGQLGSACVHDSLLLIFLRPHTSPPQDCTLCSISQDFAQLSAQGPADP